MNPKSGQTNNSPVAKLITLNLLLVAVKMRFWQNGGQLITLEKAKRCQKVDKLITLQLIYIYIKPPPPLRLRNAMCGVFHGSPRYAVFGMFPFSPSEANLRLETLCHKVAILSCLCIAGSGFSMLLCCLSEPLLPWHQKLSDIVYLERCESPWRGK